jgi:hypothetical protein
MPGWDTIFAFEAAGFSMHPINTTEAREAQIAEITRSEEDRARLKVHLNEIVQGKAFKGSPRSVKFLQYILDRAVAGEFEALKERVIGVELFGRDPTYETGEDSIVRVAAGDVRKRLIHHYSIYGTTSEFHLSLPLGSYLLEIKRCPRGAQGAFDVPNGSNQLAVLSDESVLDAEPGARSPDRVAAPPHVLIPDSVRPSRINLRSWLYFGILLVAAGLAQWAITRHQFERQGQSKISVLPWSALFDSPHSTTVVTSDPDIAEVQVLAGKILSVSDYANHRYIPEPNTLTPEEVQFCKRFLFGDKSSSVDTPIVASIAQLAQTASRKIEVAAARDIELSRLHSDDNFILLGSPSSDPWVGLFNNQLDFRFMPPDTPGHDSIVDVRPNGNESSAYFPTAPGYQTGQSFAIVALVPIPDQSGQVLILAGMSREGTEAAGNFVVDVTRLATALQNCGISPSGPVRHFEILLRINMMAGVPNKSDVLACHILPSASS